MTRRTPPPWKADGWGRYIYGDQPGSAPDGPRPRPRGPGPLRATGNIRVIAKNKSKGPESQKKEKRITLTPLGDPCLEVINATAPFACPPPVLVACKVNKFSEVQTRYLLDRDFPKSRSTDAARLKILRGVREFLRFLRTTAPDCVLAGPSLLIPFVGFLAFTRRRGPSALMPSVVISTRLRAFAGSSGPDLPCRVCSVAEVGFGSGGGSPLTPFEFVLAHEKAAANPE